MSSGGGVAPKMAGGLVETETTKVLLLCFTGAEHLACAFQAALQEAPHMETLRKDLSTEDSRADYKLLSGILARTEPSLVVFCLTPENIDGAECLFGTIQDSRRKISVLTILERAEPGQLQRLMHLGAADFCLAPLRKEELVPRILRWCFSSSKPVSVVSQLQKSVGLQQLLGESRMFLEAISKLPKLARCDANVLITGETGTGKEMCARAIHHLSPRAEHPFVPINCGAIPVELVENELFGHDAGAFTSAASTVRGMVHEAEGGTLFLDEIDSLPLQIQVKFLRFLQDQEYRPLGGRKAIRADIRIIAASNANLEEAVRTHTFRSDLFYRLNVLPLKLPALRERSEDIALLARHFTLKYAKECLAPVKELSRVALDKLMHYQWPGNVRELENIIERAVLLSEQARITADDICLPGDCQASEELSFKALKQRAIAQFESGYVRQMLATNDGNISKAARAAKKDRRAFWQLMRKHEISAGSAVARRQGSMPANQG